MNDHLIDRLEEENDLDNTIRIYIDSLSHDFPLHGGVHKGTYKLPTVYQTLCSECGKLISLGVNRQTKTCRGGDCRRQRYNRMERERLQKKKEKNND